MKPVLLLRLESRQIGNHVVVVDGRAIAPGRERRLREQIKSDDVPNTNAPKLLGDDAVSGPEVEHSKLFGAIGPIRNGARQEIGEACRGCAFELVVHQCLVQARNAVDVGVVVDAEPPRLAIVLELERLLVLAQVVRSVPESDGELCCVRLMGRGGHDDLLGRAKKQ